MLIEKLTQEEIDQSKKIMMPLYQFLKNYHDYSAKGLKNLEKGKQYIFVSNHSVATYDIILLLGDLYIKKNIFARPVVDKILVHTPILKYLMKPCRPLPANFKVLNQVLKQGDSIFIAPGGMKEALRSSEEKNTILWDDKRGFIALSITTGIPIVLAASPEADNLYDIKKSILTEFVYDKFKFPLPILQGRNKFLPFLPHKIKLTHRIEGPFIPPSYAGHDDLSRKVTEFHALICEKMKSLLKT